MKALIAPVPLLLVVSSITNIHGQAGLRHPGAFFGACL